MKTRLFFFAAALFSAYLSTAQVLYTEDFESYNTGTFSTDLTGATPAQGGWYTQSMGGGIGYITTVNDYKIVSDPNKGNVMQIVEENSPSKGGYCFVYRTDINTYWQQRIPGNNVLKLVFDIYTDTSDNDITEMFTVSLYNEKELLTNFEYRNSNNFEDGYVYLPNRGSTFPGGNGRLRIKNFPSDSWVTVELYIDYDNDQVYFSVPSLNYTIVGDTKFPLYLIGGGDHDDNPVKLELMNTYGGSIKVPPQGRKIDNINLSAQNYTPPLSINEFVSEKFNIFPNPSEDIVTIANSEAIGIKELLVYDVKGKQIFTHSYKDEHQVQLNIEDLASGTYFLHIKTDQGTGVKKLIKK